MIIQIYGSTTPEDAQMLVDLGVDHVGVAIGVSPHSFDMVPLSIGEKVLKAIPQKNRVALVITPDLDEIERVVNAVQPRILHLAAIPENMNVEAVVKLRERLPGLPIMQAIPVIGPRALDLARDFMPVSDYYLLDSFSPIMDGGVGATGKTHDWTISRQIVEMSSIPVILAGGLSPENVQAAIQAVQPAGVDSLTHTNDPANLKRKDRSRVEAFIRAAKGTTF